MKVCILGNTWLKGYKYKTYSWFVLTTRDGLIRNGIIPLEINYKTHTINQIRDKLAGYKPDYVFTHLTFHNTHNVSHVLEMFSYLYKKHNIKFIHTCSDARREDRYMGNISDSFFSAFVGTHPMVENCSKAWNIPVFYSPYSSLTYDFMSPPVDDLKFKQLVFTGGVNTHKDRLNFINLLKKQDVRLKIFSTQSKNDVRHRTKELSSSVCSILGICTGYDIPGFIDVRPFQYLGAGACLIARKFYDMDNLIPPDLYFPFNSYGKEDVKLVKEYWKRTLKEDTTEMRVKAFNYIQQHHSSQVRIKQMLNVLEGKREYVS